MAKVTRISLKSHFADGKVVAAGKLVDFDDTSKEHMKLHDELVGAACLCEDTPKNRERLKEIGVDVEKVNALKFTAAPK